MQKKDQGLDSLQKRLSINLNKSPEDLEPFMKILKDNWYDSEQALFKLTVDDYEKMKLPHRVAQAIIQQLSKGNQTQPISTKPSNNNNVHTSSLNEDTMMKITKNVAQKLLNSFNGNNHEVCSVLQVLYKIISNIVKDPYEQKYRTLKKSNNLIQNNIVKNSMCLQFMKLIGFVDSGEVLQLTKFQVPHLIFLEECLDQCIINFGGNRQKKQNINPPKQQNMFLDVKKFPKSQSDVKQQFSQEKLAQVKYIDALQHLIQIRNKMMSQAPKDRRIRIYHKRWQTKNVQIGQISFEEQFQKSNDHETVNYWKQIIASNNKAQHFQSKRKIQFQYLIKQKIHKQTLIKVKLPNQLIIQAYFGPLQRLSEVFKVVAEIVVGDLYLFTAPPKKIMDAKELNKTLIQIDAVPMGSFYLGAKDQIFYIQQEYVPLIQK